MTSVRLSDLLETGELIKTTSSPIEYGQLAMPWIAEVKAYAYGIKDTGLSYEATRLLGDLVATPNFVIGDRLRVIKILEALKQMAVYERELDFATHLKNSNTISLPAKPIGKGSILDTTFDQYTLGKQIGSGGSGRVFEAKSSDGSSYAIKILNQDVQSNKISRFKNEIGLCQRDIHPGIIKITDHGTHINKNQKQLFYVMPFYPSTFRTHMAKLSKANYVTTIYQILDAIEAAHLYKCYHRDLKPENILVDDKGRIIITDFGIAHIEEEYLITAVETKHQERLANFEYAAPEQRRKGSDVDHRADIYALGLIINEIFTGVVPTGFGFKTIKSVTPEFGYLDEIVNKMINQDPANRYQTVEVVKAAIALASTQQETYQRIDTLTNTVVNAEDISTYPLIADPIRILNSDYKDNSVHCTVNHVIPDNWFEILMIGGGANSYSTAVHWKYLTKYKNVLSYECPMGNARHCKDYIQEWIENTNRVYKERIAITVKNTVREMKANLERNLQYEKQLAITRAQLNS